jgi:hypothetical protein
LAELLFNEWLMWLIRAGGVLTRCKGLRQRRGRGSRLAEHVDVVFQGSAELFVSWGFPVLLR